MERSLKLVAGLITGVFIILTAQGCVFGGSDDGGTPSASRPGSIPTATMPATLTDPILLGQSQAVTGGNTTTSGGAGGQTYTVKSGDTLGAIATSLGVPADQQAAWIAEVLRLNAMSDARSLAVGQELTLPRLPTPTVTPRPSGTPGTPVAGTATPPRTTTPGTTPQATAAATQTPTARPTTTTGSGRTYTVVSGDTPLVIAEKLGVPAAQQAAWANELVSLNGINPNAMQVGDVLELPVGTP